MDEKEVQGITPESTPLTDTMKDELTNGRGTKEQEEAEG